MSLTVPAFMYGVVMALAMVLWAGLCPKSNPLAGVGVERGGVLPTDQSGIDRQSLSEAV